MSQMYFVYFEFNLSLIPMFLLAQQNHVTAYIIYDISFYTYLLYFY